MKLFQKAILVVHGFAGGVYDQEYLTHQLELISNYDVFTFTLPGHDGDLSKKITYQDWLNKAEEEVEFLIKNGYKQIYLIGHSMGGVIASYLAGKYSEIKKLVLVAPAFRIFGFEDGKFHITTSIPKVQKIYEQYGINIVTHRILKLPVNCFIEFMKIINEYQDCIKNVKIPTLVFRGLSDSVVPEEAVTHVINNISTKTKKLIHLKDTTHDVFRESRKEIATKYIIDFFQNVNSIDFFSEEI